MIFRTNVPLNAYVSSGLDVGGKLRAPEELRDVLGEQWDFFQNAPDKPAIIVAAIAG